MNGSGLTPCSFPLGMGTIGAGAAIPGPIGLGGGGRGGPLGGSPFPSPFSPGRSRSGLAGEGVSEEGVCGRVNSFSFPLPRGKYLDSS